MAHWQPESSQNERDSRRISLRSFGADRKCLSKHIYRLLGTGRFYDNIQLTGRTILDKKLLNVLACPVCKGPLLYNQELGELICRADRLGFPILDDIPVMLDQEARRIPSEEAI